MKFAIKIVMEAQKGLPGGEETVVVDAKDLQQAYRLSKVHMHLSPRGQLLRFFHEGVELFDERR